MKRGKLGGTSLRLLTALVLVPLTFALIWVPLLQPGFVFFIALLGAIGLHEFYRMTEAKGHRPEKTGGVLAGTALILSAALGAPYYLAVVLFIAVVLLTWLHLTRNSHTLSGLAASILGLVYVGWLAAYLVLLHQQPVIGSGLVTLLIIAVAVSDTGAYFVGKNLGRRKLAPKVSPNKTVEGAIGGTLSALIAMAAVFYAQKHFGWEAFPAWDLPRYLVVGLLLSVLGQIGDLAESMMKRDAGVKDSGEIFPGHGGVLDRCDGFLFTAPALYFLVLW